MSRTADVVVIGGGVMGLCVALRLLEDGAGTVELLERSHPGAGSSGKSGAILRQHYALPELVRLAREGLHAYSEFTEKTGREIGFVRRGMLLVASEAQRAALSSTVEMQQAEGVLCNLVDEHGLAEIVRGGFFEADSLGCWEEEAATVDAFQTVEALAAEFHERGGRLSLGESFEAIEREGWRLTGIRSSHGRIATRRLVLAAGPWSVRLLAEAGIGLPLEICRAQQAWLRPPSVLREGMPVFGDLRQGKYWRPEFEGLIRVGDLSTAFDERVEDPDRIDESASAEFLESCRAALTHRLPAMSRGLVSGGGCGLYTMTPDNQATIGALPRCEGAYLLTGFSGHGFKLAPAIARGMSEWIREGEPQAFQAEFFDPMRFARGELRSGNYEGAEVLG
ncbi:MAG TPA: FAD-binding oxidoreductase [Candidatus Krumholzibacteria bacterium]|jgi:sarcosine oxidase subunit beta